MKATVTAAILPGLYCLLLTMLALATTPYQTPGVCQSACVERHPLGAPALTALSRVDR
jgi:hypothetical protein